MKRTKKQKIIEGSIVKIELSKNRLAYGRLLPGGRIGVYNHLSIKKQTFSNEVLISFPIFLYIIIYDNVIENGVFKIIGFHELSKTDLIKIPPMFVQDIMNLNDCSIFYYDGRQIHVKPEECVDLEKASVWEAEGLIKRLEDYYDGKKNPYVELNKVILSKDDLRYLNPKLKWNFETECFYI